MEKELTGDDLLKVKFLEFVHSIMVALKWRGLILEYTQVFEDNRYRETFASDLVEVEIWYALPDLEKGIFYSIFPPSYFEAYVSLIESEGVRVVLNFSWDSQRVSVDVDGIHSGEQEPVSRYLGVMKKVIDFPDILETVDKFLKANGR